VAPGGVGDDEGRPLAVAPLEPGEQLLWLHDVGVGGVGARCHSESAAAGEESIARGRGFLLASLVGMTCLLVVIPSACGEPVARGRGFLLASLVGMTASGVITRSAPHSLPSPAGARRRGRTRALRTDPATPSPARRSCGRAPPPRWTTYWHARASTTAGARRNRPLPNRSGRR